MERIKCTIDHITYQNQENGYAVLQAIVQGYRDKQTLVGTFHEVKVGAVLTVDGDWRVMAASSPHSHGRRNCRLPSSASRNTLAAD